MAIGVMVIIIVVVACCCLSGCRGQPTESIMYNSVLMYVTSTDSGLYFVWLGVTVMWVVSANPFLETGVREMASPKQGAPSRSLIT